MIRRFDTTMLPERWTIQSSPEGAWIEDEQGRYVCTIDRAIEAGLVTEIDELGDLGVRP